MRTHQRVRQTLVLAVRATSVFHRYGSFNGATVDLMGLGKRHHVLISVQPERGVCTRIYLIIRRVGGAKTVVDQRSADAPDRLPLQASATREGTLEWPI